MEPFEAQASPLKTQHQRGQVQVVTLVCHSCGETGIRTMRPGGAPRYCDQCNDPKRRAQWRKQRQRERQKQGTAALPVSQAAHSPRSQNLKSQDSRSQDSRSQDLKFLPEGHSSLQQSCDTPRQRAAPIPVWQPTVALGRLQGFGVRPPTPALTQAAVRSLSQEERAAIAVQQEHFREALIAAWFALTPGRLGKEFMDKACWGHLIPYAVLAQQLGLLLSTFTQQLAPVEHFALAHDPERTALAFCDPLLSWERRDTTSVTDAAQHQPSDSSNAFLPVFWESRE